MNPVRLFPIAAARARRLLASSVCASGGAFAVLLCAAAPARPAGEQLPTPPVPQQPAPAATTVPTPGPTLRVRAERKEERGGIGRFTFRTDYGDLICSLPADLWPGDTVSGTVEARPKAGRAAAGEDRAGAGNAAALAALRVRLGGSEGEPVAGSGEGTRTRFRWRLAFELSPGSVAPVTLHDAAGVEVGRAAAPLAGRPGMDAAAAAAAQRPGQLRLPKGARVGEPIAVEGPFDGDASNTSVRLADRDLTVLAESPRRCVVEGPAEALGRTRLAIREGAAGGEATTTAATAAEGEFAYEKARRRNNAGPILVILGLAVVAAIAIAASELSKLGDGLGGFGGN